MTGFVAKPRQIEPGPIVPLKDGQPPSWVVRCLDCSWAHDAHGRSAAEALAAIGLQHQPGHRLTAQEIDYGTGWGPAGDKPHPMYSG